MSYLLLLPHIRIENANAVSGLTWGFPSMTHFLGYVHALSRKVVDEFGVSFDGCAVVSHEQHIQAYSCPWWHTTAALPTLSSCSRWLLTSPSSIR